MYGLETPIVIRDLSVAALLHFTFGFRVKLGFRLCRETDRRRAGCEAV